MAFSNWSTTAANNVLATTGVNFDEGQTPGSVNNSARELMAQLKAGVQPIDATLTALAALTISSGSWIKGTGADTFAVENASTTRTSLGLGTMATQNANAVDITGGNAVGLTAVSATTVTGTSDERLKSDIRPIVGALAMIEALDGVRFKWRETGKDDMGLIAQDLERIAPELVITGPDGIKTVNYFGVIGILVGAVKELAAR